MTEPAPGVPFERLLEHRSWVQALARALVHDENRADDVAQDAWLAALKHPPRHADGLRAWLGRLVRHRAADARRGDSRRLQHERTSRGERHSADPADSVARVEELERVVRSVLALTEPYRTTVVLRFYEGLTMPQIAARMDAPVETVRTRLKRALALLRERLDAEHGGDGSSWTAALVPFAWGVGGAAMKAGTKMGIVAASALMLLGATAVWTWQRNDSALTASSNGDVAKTAAASTQPPPVPQVKPRDKSVAAVYGEVWRRNPETPAAGVSVRFTSEGSPDRSVVADSRGRFRFEALPAGTRGAVRVAIDDKIAEPVAVAPLLPGESRFVGVLWLAPAVSVDVVVTSIDGSPLAGARVAAYQRPVLALHKNVMGTIWNDVDSQSATWRDLRDPAAAATTDVAGRATIAGLAPGLWHFVGEMDGFAAATQVENVEASRASIVRLALVAGFELEGRVEDRAGNPFAALVLWACPDRGLSPNAAEMTPHVTTDVDGRFVLKGLVEGPAFLRAGRRGTPPVPVGEFRVPASGPVRLVLGAAAIRGTVRESSTHEPVANARVRALDGNAWVEAVTSAEGAYEIAFLSSHAAINSLRVEGFTVVDGPQPTRRTFIGSEFDMRNDAQIRCDLTVRRDSVLRGTVTHAGRAVPGADVKAFVSLAKRDFRIAATLTDGDGKYEIPDVGGRLVIVQVVAPPFVQLGFPHDDLVTLVHASLCPPHYGVRVPADGDATLDVDLVDGVDVPGRVVDPAEQPVEGAELFFGESATTSGADGTFVFRGVDRDASSAITASKEGFLDSYGGLATLPVVIRMAPSRVVRGVVHATDGVLEGAWVQFAPRYTSDSGGVRAVDWGKAQRAPVASDGAFRFEVTSGFPRLAVRAGSLGHGPSAPVDVDGARSSEDVRIDLAPSISLRGQAISEDGAPVAGAVVEIDSETAFHWDSDGRVAPGEIAATTGSDGRFEIAALAPGTHRVLVVGEGLLPATVDVDAAAQQDVVVRLASGLEIRGTVVRSDGAPLVGASISLYRPADWEAHGRGVAYGAVRADGTFRVVAVPPGAYTAVVTPGSPQFEFAQKTFDGIVAGTTDARLVVEAGRVISGRVIGGDGVPLDDANIWLRPQQNDPQGRRSTSARSDADGRFEIAGLSDEPFFIVARPPDASFAGFGFCVNKRYLMTTLRDLVPGTTDLLIRLPLGAEIEGNLLDASGAPLAGKWIVPKSLVTPSPDVPSDPEKPGALTDESGRFVVTGLAPGRYGLDTMAEMTRTPLTGGEDVEAGARGLRLSLPRMASIKGRVVDENGAPFAGVEVAARSAAGAAFFSGTLADGTFEIKGVPGFGTYSVEAKVNKRAPMRAVDVAPGATGVQIRLVRGARVSGRLLDAAGNAITPATLLFKTEHGDIEASAYVDENGRFAVDNLLPGPYRVEQMTSKAGEFVYVPCGVVRAGDENVELRRAE